MWLFIAFLAVPLIEIALFIQVGGLIGLWWTLAIVVLTAILGTVLVRAQGALAIGDLRNALSRQSDPTETLAHGAMIILAGALLLTPGFFTDAVGFALLTPPFRKAAFNYLRTRIKVQKFEMSGTVRRHHDEGSDVIDGDYQEVDPAAPQIKRPTHGPSGWTKH